MRLIVLALFVSTPAFAITLSVPPVIEEGVPATFSVSGLRPTETVRLVVGNDGLGAGPCPAALGGACLDIVTPLTVVPRRAVGGVATMTVTLPTGAAGQEYCLQAVSLAGGGSLSEPMCTRAVSPGVAVYEGGSTYMILPEFVDQASAADACRDRGMTLFQPDTFDEAFAVEAAFRGAGFSNPFWIAPVLDGGVWTDPWGEEATYLPWAAFEPSGYVTEDCTMMQTVGFNGALTFGFDDVPCGIQIPAVCEAYGELKAFRDHRYVAVPELLSWADADAFCAGLGDALMTIESAGEERFAEFGLQGVYGDYWIGLTDLAVEGDWRDVYGQTPAFTSWHPGEPNDSGAGEDCAQVWGQGGWNDAECISTYAFVCESQ